MELDPKNSRRRRSISSSPPQSFSLPTTTPRIFLNLPDSLRWVNMRSIRYADSPTSSQNQMPSSIQKSYGVPSNDAVRERQPPKRTPSASPSSTVAAVPNDHVTGASPRNN